jgi:hypothetical protein
MTDLRKAAEMALEFVSWFASDDHSIRPTHKAPEIAEALRQALAQKEQEPVAWVYRGNFHPFDPSDWAEGETATPLYTAPPKREWIGLTEEELEPLCDLWKVSYGSVYVDEFARAIEAKLKEKNGG